MTSLLCMLLFITTLPNSENYIVVSTGDEKINTEIAIGVVTADDKTHSIKTYISATNGKLAKELLVDELVEAGWGVEILDDTMIAITSVNGSEIVAIYKLNSNNSEDDFFPAISATPGIKYITKE